MSLQDPISDMLTQIRNGQMMRKEAVITPSSKLKVAILKALQDEGYILGYEQAREGRGIRIFLKYYQEKPVIETIKRVSKPGLRIYRQKDKLPKVLGGLGVAIISTPQGIMSDREARRLGQGGEVLCVVA